MKITSEQKALLKAFIENIEMAKVVKAALLDGIYGQGTEDNPSVNWVFGVDGSLDDALYGRQVKASVRAHQILENAFTDMITLAQNDPVPDAINHAR